MLWTLNQLWHFMLSPVPIATLIGCGAAAVAVLLPPFIAAIVPNLRIVAICVAVGAFAYISVAGKFYNDGLKVERAISDKAKQDAVDRGRAARGGAASDDDSGVRDPQDVDN
jgi:hypothetical protein